MESRRFFFVAQIDVVFGQVGLWQQGLFMRKIGQTISPFFQS